MNQRNWLENTETVKADKTHGPNTLQNITTPGLDTFYTSAPSFLKVRENRTLMENGSHPHHGKAVLT